MTAKLRLRPDRCRRRRREVIEDARVTQSPEIVNEPEAGQLEEQQPAGVEDDGRN